MRDPLWRTLDGIERDIEHNISPWLREHTTIAGGPADRANAYFRQLLDIARERVGGPRT